jgi:hypothetical protein
MNEKLGTQAAQLAGIGRATLTPLVQSALNSETVEVVNWECEQLHGGIGLGTAIYRFSGEGHDREEKAPWSLVLKTLRPAGDNANVCAWNYYKREADAYQSGLLDDLPGGLVAPRCFGVLDHPDDTCWVWLEDIRDEIGSQWPLERYGVAARHAGQLNGAYLVERSLPSWPWLSSDWLRGHIARSASAMPLIRNSLDHPLVRRGFPDDSSDRLFRLWEERDRYLDALDRLPRTLCHLDLFRRNLFARKTADGDDQTVAIDWAFVGQGAIGEEIANLVFTSLAFNEVDLAQAQALEDIVFEGYLEGLRDVGWRGDPQQVRLGYTAGNLRLRLGELDRVINFLLDESQYHFAEQAFGRSMEEIEDHFAQVNCFVDSLIDEARGLMGVLS